MAKKRAQFVCREQKRGYLALIYYVCKYPNTKGKTAIELEKRKKETKQEHLCSIWQPLRIRK